LVAAVGLVLPPKGIVLWDEWSAALKRLSQKNPESRRDAKPSAINQSTRRKKEVREDRNRKMAV
jgi:hypothetical protein